MEKNSRIIETTINLLSLGQLDQICAFIAQLVQSMTKSQFTAVLMWDPDLESFADRFIFGSATKDIEPFLQAFCENFCQQDQDIQEIQEDTFDVAAPAPYQPLFCYQIYHEQSLVACLLFTAHKSDPEKNLAAHEALKTYPLAISLLRAWNLRELQKENTRLRDSYEQLEDKTSLLEEQTRKLIHDLTAKDTIRTKHVERERLIYSISNVVRSYVDIQKVLETTVERIGATLAVSRCILLRTFGRADQINVYEYTRGVQSVRDLFLTPEGIAFTTTALQRATPHDLGDPESDDQQIYDRNFLRQLDIRSGLIIPLLLRERVLGVLFLQDCAEARAWSIDDISLIGSLADQVSVGIENAELHQEKERQAVTDGLTGIANRRCFTDTFAREFERARRYGQPLSLVLIDLDFLKVINDSFGHQVGDEAIKEIGQMLKESSRSIDLAARYGGEEFCLLLPNTDIIMAEQFAERLRRLINNVHIKGPGHISASFGVASYPIDADNADLLFRRADEALYEAKQSGRNMVKVAERSSSNGRGSSKLRALEKQGKVEERPIIDAKKKSNTKRVSK